MSSRDGLRFDKVVLRVTKRLRESLDHAVPEDTTVLVTVTAPIRQPGKTAEAIVRKVQARLARRTSGRDVTATIHANRVRIRIVTNRRGRASTVLVFVHNPEIDSRRVLDAAR